MRDGKRWAQWDHTAAILTTLRRVHGDKKVTYKELHPYIAGDPVEQRKRFKEVSRAAQRGQEKTHGERERHKSG